ncbi:MAG: 6-phosphogluconate dehydrogenase (decarboxylating) [Elusimicrobia bacterium RIFOXYA12_FULL_51_18]|nr:MAG: 6-phosphogluconate dehydrogenase (decarboxylating) [Elusimicrobia bacterium RIFOXYA12_FULL_51_18]OGS28987.1 MAG: 6-phosphogluconate dehydrogenase (decarboxylating) [Elusimicrobia bacterium RIFOXYA2_FULL_53_38]
MKIGLIGLGRMGSNIARRLLRKGHKVAVYNRTPERTEALEKEGAIGVYSLGELSDKLDAFKIVWLMLPAGGVTEAYIQKSTALLKAGDILINGANSHYKDSIKTYKFLKAGKIGFLDVGVSGGIRGLENGYCVMAGGEKPVFKQIEPLLKDLCSENGYMHCGAPGAGHFMKMVHNGIEYGMMEAYGEGFELLKASPYGDIDPAEVSKLWNSGSVIRSWLLELAGEAFKKDPGLKKVKSYVEDSGEGRWSVEEAVRLAVPVPAIAAAVFKRFRSRQRSNFSDKLLAALRKEFGGHEVKKSR